MGGPGASHRTITSRPAGSGARRSCEEAGAAWRATSPAGPGGTAVGILGLPGLEERRACVV